MSQQDVKSIVLAVAAELSQQGFVLDHEVALQGEWEQAKVDKALLYATVAKLEELQTKLLFAAQSN